MMANPSTMVALYVGKENRAATPVAAGTKCGGYVLFSTFATMPSA
jgi:hypothetical protein